MGFGARVPFANYTVLGLEGADRYAATLELIGNERNDVWNCPQ